MDTKNQSLTASNEHVITSPAFHFQTSNFTQKIEICKLKQVKIQTASEFLVWFHLNQLCAFIYINQN